MLDDDLHRLRERAPDHSLDRLESDIWQGVAARAVQRQTARRTASLQGVVMVAALIGSVTAGILLARPAARTGDVALTASGVELTPSALLLGDRR